MPASLHIKKRITNFIANFIAAEAIHAYKKKTHIDYLIALLTTAV